MLNVSLNFAIKGFLAKLRQIIEYMKRTIISTIFVCIAAAVFGQTAADYEAIQREHLRKKKIEVGARNDKYSSNLLEKIPSGYVGSFGVEINAPGAYPESAAGITTVHGYMVKPKIFIGGGIGYMHSVRYEQGIIPLFAEARFYFSSEYMRRIYPHLGFRLGAQFATEGDTGTYAQAACGFRVPVNEHIALNLEVGPQYVTKYNRGGRHDLTVTYKEPWKSSGYIFGFFGRLSVEF